jgi:hypothetical protein
VNSPNTPRQFNPHYGLVLRFNLIRKPPCLPQRGLFVTLEFTDTYGTVNRIASTQATLAAAPPGFHSPGRKGVP